MNIKLIAIILLTALLGCDEPHPTLVCRVKNPTQDLPWLNEIVTKAEEDKATRSTKVIISVKFTLKALKVSQFF